LKVEGNEEEANKMQAKMMALCGSRVVVALLLILAVSISVIGCATSYLKTYQTALRAPDAPKYRMVDWKIEHNLLNGRYTKLDKDDLD
jgi:hypothetical protein